MSFAGRVNSGHFRILKGNIAEIFSMDIQRKVLDEIAKREPEAHLFSGVFIRIWDSKKGFSQPLLFSDNIIATVKESGVLKIEAVFEVKSGFIGGYEAQVADSSLTCFNFIINSICRIDNAFKPID